MKDFLKEQIAKSGYPLEVAIHSELEPIWIVKHDAYFLDDEENKSRLLDIHAFANPFIEPRKRLLKDGIEPFVPVFNLAIECKKSEDYAWVFFTLPTGETRFLADGQYLDDFQPLSLSNLFFLLDPLLHYSDFSRFASPFSEVKLGKPSGKRSRNEIYEGVNQLVKFVSYQIAVQFETWKGDRIAVNNLRESLRMFFFFPILVFDGRLYEAVVEKGDIELRDSDHVVLERHHKPSYSATPLTYKIDIAKREFFPDLVRIIERDIERIQEEFVQNKGEFDRTIEQSIAYL